MYIVDFIHKPHMSVNNRNRTQCETRTVYISFENLVYILRVCIHTVYYHLLASLKKNENSERTTRMPCYSLNRLRNLRNVARSQLATGR